MLGNFFKIIFLIGIAILTIYMMCNNSLPAEKNKLNNPSLTEDVGTKDLSNDKSKDSETKAKKSSRTSATRIHHK